MSTKAWFVVCAALVAAGCSTGAEVEWMKVGQPYTAAEFRRDYSECDKSGKLEACLRSRGWVSVTAPAAQKQAGPEMRAPGGGIVPPKGY